MSSSGSDDLDAFLESLRPKKKEEKYRLSSGSLDGFVVDNDHVSFCEDGDASPEHVPCEDFLSKDAVGEMDGLQNYISNMNLSSRSASTSASESSGSDKEDEDSRRGQSKLGGRMKTKRGAVENKRQIDLRNRGSFTPKRSTASRGSVYSSTKKSVVTPKIVFSSDSEEENVFWSPAQPPKLPAKENTAPPTSKHDKSVGSTTPARKPPFHSSGSARKSSNILVFSDDSDTDSDNDVVYLGEIPSQDNDEMPNSHLPNDHKLKPLSWISDDASDEEENYTPLIARISRKPENRVLGDLQNRDVEKDGKKFPKPRSSLPDVYQPFKKPQKVPLSEKPVRTKAVVKRRSDGLPPALPLDCEKGAGFKKHRQTVTAMLYSYFNQTIFENKLPADMLVEWNKRLLKTAGVTKCSRKVTTTFKDGIKCVSRTYNASISLSEKVLDTLHRLRDTLCHEMCHAAVWLLDHQNEGHGVFWKAWARKAMAAHPEMPVVRRCHSYDISYKHSYQCTICRKVYGRHSKSINVDKQACGLCRGRLVLLPPTKSDGTPAKSRQPNKFAMFVKENYKSVQQAATIGHATPKHADVMKALSDKFASMSTKK